MMNATLKVRFLVTTSAGTHHHTPWVEVESYSLESVSDAMDAVQYQFMNENDESMTLFFDNRGRPEFLVKSEEIISFYITYYGS